MIYILWLCPHRCHHQFKMDADGGMNEWMKGYLTVRRLERELSDWVKREWRDYSHDRQNQWYLWDYSHGRQNQWYLWDYSHGRQNQWYLWDYSHGRQNQWYLPPGRVCGLRSIKDASHVQTNMFTKYDSRIHDGKLLLPFAILICRVNKCVLHNTRAQIWRKGRLESKIIRSAHISDPSVQYEGRVMIQLW